MNISLTQCSFVLVAFINIILLSIQLCKITGRKGGKGSIDLKPKTVVTQIVKLWKYSSNPKSKSKSPLFMIWTHIYWYYNALFPSSILSLEVEESSSYQKCNATIITAYYKIKSKSTYEAYLSWMTNFLTIKDWIVVFTSPLLCAPQTIQQ